MPGSKTSKTHPGLHPGRRPGDRWRQCAALPIRVNRDGRLQALLLTSRETKRWVIPKGWPMRRLSPADTALREAFEEAGAVGFIVRPEPIGSYTYAKVLADRRARLVLVDVYLMLVGQQAAAWPEQAERHTVWVGLDMAASMVAEPELAAIFCNLDLTATRTGAAIV